MSYIELTAPKTLHATIRLPLSKSIGNRLLVMQYLCGKDLSQFATTYGCADLDVMHNALCTAEPVKDLKMSGTALRFLTALYAILPSEVVLTGSERLCQRPIAPLVEALRTLGADIQYEQTYNYAPLKIKGQALVGGEVSISAQISSQFISALLLVAPYMERGLTLQLLPPIASRPYIDLTIGLMKAMGAQVEWTDEYTIRILPKPYNDLSLCWERDWSAASYWYESLALCPKQDAQILLPNLFKVSLQGDSVTRHVFKLLGVHTKFANEGILLTKKALEVSSFTYDFQSNPDIAQSVCATCIGLHLPFLLNGVGALRDKETDRINALVTECSKLGAQLTFVDDQSLHWDGQLQQVSLTPQINTWNDHRMALAFAPLSFMFPGLRIESPEVVCKSYPNYWKDLQEAGWTIQ